MRVGGRGKQSGRKRGVQIVISGGRSVEGEKKKGRDDECFRGVRGERGVKGEKPGSGRTGRKRMS